MAPILKAGQAKAPAPPCWQTPGFGGAGAFACLFLLAAQTFAATFGTVVTIIGETSDLVYDESRGRLYVVNSTQNRIEIYAPAQHTLLSPIAVDQVPIAAAQSRNGRYLYVTSYGTGVLDVIDLDSSAVTARVNLPAAPEGVAVGADERVLITSPGTGTAANPQNTFLLYDPTTGNVISLPISLPGPTTPATTQGISHSRLIATPDGSFIIGLNNPNTTSRQIFVYETASAGVLRSRTVSNISSVLSVSADGSRFMAGLTMFETATLTVMAQQNSANSAYPFPTTANFNTQSNQGGSVFAPDGSVLYSAFNIAPVNSTQPSVSQLMLNDPDNLLINLALQLPENLIGRMISTADGSTLYALSSSGFMALPVSTIYNNPIAVPQNSLVMLTNDQCGVTAATAAAQVPMMNLGKGRFTAVAQVATTGVTSTQGLGPGGNGPGGGFPGGGFPIILPGGGGPIMIPNTGNPTNNNTTPNTATTTPILTTKQTDSGAEFDFAYNTALTSMGTPTPSDFYVTSPQAINLPPLIRVTQNNRNAEAPGTVMPLTVGASASEGLMDMAVDNTRQRLYIANSGLNCVEVFDMPGQQFLSPIKVGQLPHSLAIAPDGNTMYVANTGGESISIIDLNQGAVTGKVQFPMVAFNASAALVTPSIVAAGLSGVQIVMSDGSLWAVRDGVAAPRATSSVIGSSTITSPRSMVATPDGRYIMLLGGNGMAYLYDASSDAYVISQQVVSTPIQGYYGPVGAATAGQYYLVNGLILDGALSVTGTAALGTTQRPVSAVYPINGNMFARFVQPSRTSATAAVTSTATIELVDAAGNLRGSTPALEGPLSTQVGTQRANINPRTMAVNAAATTAYMLTASGLSSIPLNAPLQVVAPGPGTGPPTGPPTGPVTGANSTLPQVNTNGVVNNANFGSSLAPGSLVTILGQNLASSASAPGTPLPSVLGGTCVTLDNAPLPLMLTSSGQINAQLPPKTTAAKHTLIVRSIDQKAAAASQSVTVSKYAPAVFVDAQSGQAAIYHEDGSPVTKSNPATRDQKLYLYATGLGATTGGTVTAGMPSPSSPLAVTAAVSVYFGDPSYSQSGIIVNWSGLVPGMIGVYQVNVTVPGTHMKGDALPVTLKIGGVSSPTTGSSAPLVALQ
jgi:uncharacterized protein (TIGR03437 family)